MTALSVGILVLNATPVIVTDVGNQEIPKALVSRIFLPYLS